MLELRVENLIELAVEPRKAALRRLACEKEEEEEEENAARKKERKKEKKWSNNGLEVSLLLSLLHGKRVKKVE